MNTQRLRQALVASREDALRLLLAEPAIARHPAIASATRPATVIAIGKAAPNMLRQCASLLDDEVASSLVITTDSTDAGELPAHTQLLRASHPVPDDRSLEAAERALALAASVPANGTLVVLVSGGASSLVCAPPPGLSFEAKRQLVDHLLRSGAPIQDVNTVRRHLSRIKGGGLAAASRARVICAIASDVLGGHPHDVGSGPACVDPTSRVDAERVLLRQLGEAGARALSPLLTHGLPPDGEQASRVDARIVMGPAHFAAAVAEALSRRGLLSRFEERASCSAAQLALDLVRQSRRLAPGQALVLASEPTLRVPARAGRGGRAGWVALRVLAEAELPADAAFLCASSDGVDGNSGAAGACVARDVACEPAELRRALESFDDAAVHRSMGTTIEGGATGLNLTDVYVCARLPLPLGEGRGEGVR